MFYAINDIATKYEQYLESLQHENENMDNAMSFDEFEEGYIDYHFED